MIKDMIRLLPFLVILVLVGAVLFYLRSKAEDPLTQPSDYTLATKATSVTPTPTLPPSDTLGRLKLLEEAVINLTKRVNGTPSQPALNDSQTETRLQKLETDLGNLQKLVAQLDKLTPTPGVVSAQSDFYIPLAASVDTTDQNYVSLESAQISLDPADFSGYSGIQLEVNMKLAEAVGTGYARFYNQTDQTGISGSEVSATSDKYGLSTSGSFKLSTGRKTYRLQAKSSQGYQLFLQNVRLKVMF